MTPEMERRLIITVSVMQALLGLLSTNIRAVSIEFLPDNSIRTHFQLHDVTDEDRTAIEEEFPTEVGIYTADWPEVGEVLFETAVKTSSHVDPGAVSPGFLVLKLRDTT